MTIGKTIETLRISMGMTQEELAKRLEITKQAIWKYENEKITNIPMDKIKILADVFRVTPAMIMGWETTLFSQPECHNRLGLICESRAFPQERISRAFSVSEDEYLTYKGTYITTPDDRILSLSNELRLPSDFIIGKSYKTTVPFTDWRLDQREDWLSGNEDERIILECMYGRPIFSEKSPSDRSQLIPPSSEQENTLLKAFRGTTEEGRMRIIQAVFNICDEIERKETIAKSQSNAG